VDKERETTLTVMDEMKVESCLEGKKDLPRGKNKRKFKAMYDLKLYLNVF